ncbi:MAG: hypothetical protein ACE5HF_09060 [Gemmatimonadota bacterium]
MRNRLGAGLALALALSGTLGVVRAAAADALAKPKIVVKIGATIDEAKVAEDHDVSMRALQRGQTEFTVKADDHEYAIRLTPEQIVDLLDGTTVMVETEAEEGHDPMAVSVEIQGLEPEESGW